MEVLEQKRGLFSKQKFILYQDKIVVETQNITEKNKYEIALDKLGHQIQYRADSTIVLNIACAVCMLIPVVLWVLYFFDIANMDKGTGIVNTIIWWLLCIIFRLRTPKDDIFVVGGQYSLSLFRNNPNEDTVLTFVEKIITYSKKYLKQKYAVIDLNLPEDIFIGRINWLKDENIIDEVEYASLSREYQTKKMLS
jgi:hypothetical protein